MKIKLLIILVFIVLFFNKSKSQSIGVSYFFPNHGYFSIPVAPLTYSQSFQLFDFFSIAPGGSLFSIGGMNLKDLPEGFSSVRPLAGPFHSVILNLQGIITIPIRKIDFNLKGGGFAFYNIDLRLLDGNIDRMIASSEKWDAATSDMKFDSKIGYGYLYGVSLTYYISKTNSLEFGANVYTGLAPINLRGTYIGGNIGGQLEKRVFPENKSKLDFSGIEAIVSFSF
ncbi:MAG: hypothetical protein Q8880_07920 [Bacteroidota bacterium]|nr:hypothetical protein [Bacteroidota bacterium]